MALPFDPNGRDGDNQGPYPKPPRSPTIPRPRSQIDPDNPASDKAVTASESGGSLPLVFGTAKVAGRIIEQYSATVLAGPLKAPAWLLQVPYSVGDRVTANGNAYVATKAGISANSGTGPSGTGTGIVDGITSPIDIAVHWDFVEAGTDLIWRPSTTYTVNLMTTRVLANGNFYVLTQTGTSAATGTGPSGTGTGIVDNGCVWNYVPAGWRTQFAAAFCEGQIFGALGGWSDGFSNTKNYTAIANEGILLALGTPTGGGRPVWFPTPDATFADSYANVAVLYISSLGGADRKGSNIALEIQSGAGVDATHLDMNPADIAIDLLTHARRGAGWLTARVDTTGTLAVGVASSYRNYCTANGLLLSWVIDTQAPAMQFLGLLLAATNTDAVWTGGMLKFFPRSDQAITANGTTYTPNLTPAYNLTQDDIIGFVEVSSRRSGALSFNDYPVEYTDRAMGYVRNLVDDPAMEDIDKRGTLKAGTVPLPQIIAPATAIMLSRILAQRSIRVRNTYKFRLPHRFMLLDPCDIVTLTDPVSGLTAQPVRITAIEEDQAMDGQFLFEAEDFPGSVHAAAQYPPQTGDGFRPNRGTAIGQAVLLPSNTPGQTVVDSSSTRGPAVHNIWPNGSSEDNPPDGALTTRPEWASRVNAGVGVAFAGSWVRELSAVAGAADIFLGDQLAGVQTGFPRATGETALSLKVRCSPGDSFVLEAYARGTAKCTGSSEANLWVAYMDSNEAFISGTASNFGLGFGLSTVPTAWILLSTQPNVISAPATAAFVVFRLSVDAFGGGATGTATAQFDAITVYKKNETSSDAASTAPSLTLTAGGNTFTDLPGTSQSFTPNTASRKIKVTLAFSGYVTGTTAAAVQDLRIVFGGTPTQAGSIYKFAYGSINTHLGWPFMWVLPAATLGPVGTAVTVKAQVRSPTGNTAVFTMDGNDAVSMVIEEIG